MSNVACKSRACLCPPSSPPPCWCSPCVCVVRACALACACRCLQGAPALTAAHLAPQWTMEVQLRLGSAQMSLHSRVPRCVTLFPVTFSAINLQTYSDGAPPRGYIVPVCRTFSGWRQGSREQRPSLALWGHIQLATCKSSNAGPPLSLFPSSARGEMRINWI